MTWCYLIGELTLTAANFLPLEYFYKKNYDCISFLYVNYQINLRLLLIFLQINYQKKFI